MNPNASIEFLQDQLNQYQARMANNNPLSNHNNSNDLLNQFANNNSNVIPAPIPPNQINLIQNQNETVISNHTYSLIIEYWFRTTKPSTITNNDKNESKSPEKENGINAIITEYCTPIFRVLPIPKENHGYGSMPSGPNIHSTPEQWNAFINTIATSNNGPVLNSLLSPRYPINWDEEFVVFIVSHHGSPPRSIDLKYDEYEINKDNNSLIVVIETDNGRTDEASCCAMAYYAFCIVVNKLRGFEKIGVKSRCIETHVPQCTSILPTDDLSAINRKVQQHYANLTADDYDRKVYEGITYKDINGAPNQSYNDPFGGLM